MKTRFALLTAAALSAGFICAAAAQQAEPGVPDQLKVTINTQQTSEPVSKYIFGSFIEHIGTIIYRSMWAEMLDDRKFYFPISSTDPQVPARTGGNPMRMPLHKWRPVGADDVVAMDTDMPFVGDREPEDSVGFLQSARHPASRSLVRNLPVQYHCRNVGDCHG